MLICKLDSQQFDDKASAVDHLRLDHSELIDDELAEFISEAEDNVFQEQFEEEDE
jgi:hypothetical protein